LKRIPQGKIPLLYAFYPEEPGRNEIRPQVPFAQEIPSGKQVVEKEDGGKEEGQDSPTIG
jgi:hypothetical protein